MKRMFLGLENKGYKEIKVIDTERGTFTMYNQELNLGFTFGGFTQNIKDIGYNSVDECIKIMKSRGLINKELNIKDQIESEKIGFINLGIDRIKRAERINTNDFKDVIEKLSSYGLGFVDAQNVIIESYLNREEREVV